MLVRVVLASLVGAAVMMVWGFVFWSFSGIPAKFFGPAPEAEAMAESLKQHVGKSGVYFHPWWEGDPADAEVRAARAKKHREGPIVHLFYVHEGAEEMPPDMFAKGFAQMFAMSLFAAIVLALGADKLRSYFARLGIVLLLALFVLVINLGHPIWFHHPWGYHLMYGGSQAVSLLLSGLVLAAIVKAPAADASNSG